jgi:hypothetical protein
MKLKNLATAFVSLLAIISLYLFSRFTVDDAFISWRYGKNLVDFGVWNYNPSTFDLTQAYTNPIYAVLSIVPSLFGWDVVLFFKLVSIALLIVFVGWFGRKTNGSWLMILALVGLPATVLHLFGGLETFLFVFLMAALLIAAYEEKMFRAIVLALLLFVTRPEAWTLVVLLPLYFLLSEPRAPEGSRPGLRQYIRSIRLSPSRFAITLACLAVPLAAYFWFHHHQFGSALPNTFYVKLAGSFSPQNFVIFALFVLPVAVLLPVALLLYFGRIRLALMMGAVFGAMVLNYAASNLQMNYAGRFAFHIFVPVYLFFVYLASQLTGRLYISGSRDFRAPITLGQSAAAKGLLLCGLSAFAMISDNFSSRGVTYYPRLLFAHAALGQAIHQIAAKDGIRAFSLADAGVAAYRSDINALDSIGLGSSAVARNGLQPALLDKYKVDLVVFHATAEGIRLDVFNQQKIYDWAIANNFRELCDIYWQKDYILKVYSRKPIPEISEVCAVSKVKNNVTDRALFKSAIQVPPWKFWAE